LLHTIDRFRGDEEMSNDRSADRVDLYNRFNLHYNN